MGGGAPNIKQINPAEVVNAILTGIHREMPQLRSFENQQPLFQGASKIAQQMTSGVGALTGPLQNLLSGMPSVSGLTNPLQSALNRDAGIVATGGRMTPSEAASLNAPVSAELASAGMGHTAPGVFELAQNTYNEMQNRVNTAISQEGHLAPAIEQLRSEDVGLRTAIPGAIQSLQSGAAGTALETMLGGISGYTGLGGMLAGPIASQILANQQAQAASATAGANKSAGLGAGGLGAAGNILGGIISAIPW